MAIYRASPSVLGRCGPDCSPTSPIVRSMSTAMHGISPYDDKATLPPQEEVDVLDKNNVQDMTAEDRATALKLALAADPGIPVRSWRMVQMTLCMLVVCMCGGDAGESCDGR